MSTVNLTETLIRVRDQQPQLYDEIEFAYALATVEKCPTLTLDPDFRFVDRPVVLPDGETSRSETAEAERGDAEIEGKAKE